MPDLQEQHWTNEPKAERIHATRLGYRPFICSEPRAALDHVTPRRDPVHVHLGDVYFMSAFTSARHIF